MVARMATAPEQRLDWAREHLERLRSAATKYLDTVLPSEDDYAVATGVSAVEITVDEEPPVQIGLMAGDAIHNLGAAIDNLVWELAGTTATRAPQSGVPHQRPQTTFMNRRSVVLAGVDPAVVFAICTCQPFVPANQGGLAGDGGRLLGLLNDFLE